ncbi:steroid 3-ketoacyl-CoA thiolase [Rhodococcus sp. WAY2]|uniref:thiolase family protein n=1 Tax=Rhodococcus sp. WAY2 TaxID=2663121 RepID=UPI0013567B9D|nr:steroid 3-ketoacyl-CoA thiolase [Rhodococcus sp. WAY2]
MVAASGAVATCTDEIDAVIADVARSPLSFREPGSVLAGIRPADLLAQVVAAMLDRTHLRPGDITRVLVGGGPAYADIARLACEIAGVKVRVEAPDTTRGSLQAVIHEGVRAAGPRDVVLVLGVTGEGGVDAAARSTRRGVKAELVAATWSMEPEILDAYARRSRQRARDVALAGEFANEIVPAVKWDETCQVVTADETVLRPSVPSDGAPLFYDPEFAEKYPSIGWHLNSGNVSQPASGAAAAILVRAGESARLGLRPRARILGIAENPHRAGSPNCGPVEAARSLLIQSGLQADDLDHYEVAESYAPIPVLWRREFNADPERFNPRGGSIGLGHVGPADGLRSLATALSALELTGGRLGILASEGFGSAGDAMIIERIPRLTSIV